MIFTIDIVVTAFAGIIVMLILWDEGISWRGSRGFVALVVAFCLVWLVARTWGIV